uniref:Uncharacterized protein n=1 Tax=viral metagenome TaxID=1070528 RepID=A0A6C0AP52_9ZZZZ
MPSEHELRPPYPEGVVKILEGPHIRDCCVLKNGNIVSTSHDASLTLRVWDVATGECLKVLEGHTQPLLDVCVVDIPEGERVVSGSRDMTLRVWDVATGECLKVLGSELGGIRCLYALGNSRVISSHGDGNLRVWNVVTGECLQTIHDDAYNMCSLGEPGSERLVTVSSKWMYVWDLATGIFQRVLAGHGDKVFNVCTVDTPQGKRLVSGSLDMTLRVWDVDTGACIRVLNGHTSYVGNVCDLGDGRVVSSSLDNTLRVWDINKKNSKILKIVMNKHNPVLAKLSPTSFVCSSNKSGFIIWDIRNLKDFSEPDRSGFFHTVQNTLRGKSFAKVAPEASTVSAPAASTVTTVNPIGPLGRSNTIQAWKGGRIQGKRKSKRNKRKVKSRKSRKSRY